MFASLKRRIDAGEGGFTLIELLVVMIIISILMAVAVPAYLGQKNKAVASTAKSNVKSAVDTIESCAASLTDGTYGTGATACTTQVSIKANEPSLGNLTWSADGANPAAINNYSVGTLASGGQNLGYWVAASINVPGAPGPVFFAYKKDPVTAAVTKTCGTTLAAGTATVANPKVCPANIW